MKSARVFLLCAGLSLPRVASADVPPLPGQAERCTLSEQQKPGETCVSCNTYFGEPDACGKQHASRGFSRRCRTRGASTWSELWCKGSSGVEVSSTRDAEDAATAALAASTGPSASPSATPAASAPTTPGSMGPNTGAPSPSTSPEQSPPPAPEKSGACGACQVGHEAGGAAAFGLALGGLVASRMRRRRRRYQARGRFE